MTPPATSPPKTLPVVIRQFLFLAVLGAALGALQFFRANVESWFGVTPGPDIEELIRIVSGVLFWMVVAQTLVLTINYTFWERWVEAHQHRDVPKLLKDITAIVVWATVAVAVMSGVLNVSVTGVLTASGIVIAVIGFALRGMIADLFTGIALGVEQPIRTDDWIRLEDGTVGRVVEMNWRATRLVTKDEVMIVVPNSYLASTPFTNYHAPETFWRDRFRIILSHDVTANQAERILMSAVRQVPESVAVPRRPEVRLLEYNENGVVWEVRYWVPDYQVMPALRDQVQRNVLRNLHFSGVRVPRNRIEILNATHPMARHDSQRHDLELLHSMEIFSELDDDELEQLRENLVPHVCPAGTPIVRQGEAGDSMFLVKEGCLEVTIRNESGADVLVATQTAGMFFGDASLLTGEPRSATVTPSVDSVVLEIRKEAMAELIERRPAIVEYMGAVLAERQMRNDEKLRATPSAEREQHKAGLSQRIAGSILRFFGLRPGEA